MAAALSASTSSSIAISSSRFCPSHEPDVMFDSRNEKDILMENPFSVIWLFKELEHEIRIPCLLGIVILGLTRGNPNFILILYSVLLFIFLFPITYSACHTCREREDEDQFDVFLCFTGKTRGGFTSHLVRELKQAGIRTFTDVLLPRGVVIADALTGRIKGSRSTIVVVSKDFAASEWCLNEVMESFICNEEKVGKRGQGHLIFPIFYKVDPSELRHLTGTTAHYLALHEQRYGSNSDKVAWWKKYLTRLSNNSGWHFTSGGNESDLIQTIVKDVAKALRMKNTALE